MPSTITHEYYYRDVYGKTHRNFKKIYGMDDYRRYSSGAQGHDALFFSDFWKLYEFNTKRDKAIFIQDHKFQNLCLKLIQNIEERNLKDSKEIKLLLYGYMLHHILDAYMHPYIIYQTEFSGLHEEFESYLDLCILKSKENKNPSLYPVHKLIPKLPNVQKDSIDVISDSFESIYGYKDFGNTYINALKQIPLFLGLFRYDPTGIKNIGYSIIDKVGLVSINFSWLSYKHKYIDFAKYLNEEHNVWINPVDDKIESCLSVRELYELALEEGARIISELDVAIQDNAKCDELKLIIPNISAIHGQKCDQNKELKYIAK